MGNNIVREEMKPITKVDKWVDPRLHYLHSFIKPLPTYCPECGGEVDNNIVDYETICTDCGLVVSGTIEYVSLKKICYDYGRH